MKSTYWDAVVVGGGFFGCMIAERLRRYLRAVAVVEAAPDLCRRASYVNQARVHHGYHYPRSLLTALRSRVNFSRFVAEFGDAVVSDFEKVYAIARQFSKVTARYFEEFCGRIGAPLAAAPKALAGLFDPAAVEAVYSVKEYAFDADRLRALARGRLESAGVAVRADTRVRAIRPGPGGLEVDCLGGDGPTRLHAGEVFNCTYAQLNEVLAAADRPALPLKHELTEVCLVEVPAALRRVGITVMCGPFWSCMPFPARGLHSLTHVRYTPHLTWEEGPDRPAAVPSPADTAPRNSRFGAMARDAARFLPLLGGCIHRDSLWQVKTVLPASEANDSRPILYRTDAGLPGLHCVLGAKLDNIYDVLDAVDSHYAKRRACG